MNIRIGHGYDVHRLEEGLKLVIGGITIPHTKGCVAHSDGDVLIHAICDALLGAAALRDIGFHFPDTSNEFKGIDSKILLKRTFQLLNKYGYSLVNIDSTICLQKPKIQEYIPEMIRTLANTLEVNPDKISIKATTTEKLGFIGNEEGISAHAVVLIQKIV
ncbi:MAG: 2-C-methyl-D-erythritol 2,4-cyclodiphosphate synthase [Bacteroidetes bacterium GWC2_33_15]|nr:MAG: 2-C-methyl-D-erythritol 2,4-cyclodiphosphate synthase [Bacteroidetes bacterium GWA2_33_15]OFX48821.1 MAG: 2-C-methyl-D-erythritol 2,4-cyclodiphosphate synthase [Bacteroidetes bacterium GWC2_33_15]OFX66064.1 MAG: 2-C-methyl-D-erythritol 2,4-cyclodiphosphate synthase [Bacteroidetes bacterium GWB2_32_14]OFX68174.1 MAG: 2-C-methyl-D-erythritol 2,4-cyclodiphosphate synthase [Bacteroidetes bacterium GWD2_33_33]HAN17948.1 2-C-methyl-D-erythritol 2,4-cyclodiphosphate synthase [Bacteroidales bac